MNIQKNSDLKSNCKLKKNIFFRFHCQIRIKTTKCTDFQCKEGLTRLGQLSAIISIWIPTNRYHFGDEQANELARLKSAQSMFNVEFVAIPFGVIKCSKAISFSQSLKVDLPK